MVGGFVDEFLEESKYIDYNDPAITIRAALLAQAAQNKYELARMSFEFVRDQIKHSWDYTLNPVTCRASDVLKYKTGSCYAKSHLLAALLRKNGIPAGLCYQRLSVKGSNAPYCLHGLNTVYLERYGWYRIDARGNKSGVNAQFCPPQEALAFLVRDSMERDLPEIWAEPLPLITDSLKTYSDVEEFYNNLPDMPLLDQF